MAHDDTEPYNTIIIASAAVTMVIIFVVFFACIYFFSFWKQAHVRDKVERKVVPDLGELRAAEAEKLFHYALVETETEGDQIPAQTGGVRIPIDRAMELEAINPWRRQLDLPLAVTPEEPEEEAAPAEEGAEPAPAQSPAPPAGEDEATTHGSP